MERHTLGHCSVLFYHKSRYYTNTSSEMTRQIWHDLWDSSCEESPLSPNYGEWSSADVDTNQLKVLFFSPYCGWIHKQGRRDFFAKTVKPVAFIVFHHYHTYTGCSPGIWERATDPSILGSNVEDYSPLPFLFWWKSPLPVLLTDWGPCATYSK